jgi:hypothetical protein
MRGPMVGSVTRPWTVAVATVALLTTVLMPGEAGALPNRGATHGPETVTTGTWGAAASPSTLTWAVAGSRRQTTTVTNTGTVALTQLTYKVTMSSGIGTATFRLAACANVWTAGGACPGGGATAIGGTYAIGSITTVMSPFVPAVGGNFYLKATASRAVTATITMTLQISVTSNTQLRARIVSNQ